MVWPAIERYYGAAVLPLLGATLALTISLQLALAHWNAWPDLPRFLAQTSFVPVLLGVALAHALDDSRGFALVHAAVGHRFMPIATGLIAIESMAMPAQDISGLPRLLITLALLAFVASCVVQEDHALVPLLTHRLVAWIGTLSYGMYLLHMLARHVAVKLLAKAGVGIDAKPDGFALFVLTLLLTLALAALSYRWLESPFLRLKQRIGDGRPAPRPATAAPGPSVVPPGSGGSVGPVPEDA